METFVFVLSFHFCHNSCFCRMHYGGGGDYLKTSLRTITYYHIIWRHVCSQASFEMRKFFITLKRKPFPWGSCERNCPVYLGHYPPTIPLLPPFILSASLPWSSSFSSQLLPSPKAPSSPQLIFSRFPPKFFSTHASNYIIVIINLIFIFTLIKRRHCHHNRHYHHSQLYD